MWRFCMGYEGWTDGVFSRSSWIFQEDDHQLMLVDLPYKPYIEFLNQHIYGQGVSGVEDWVLKC